MRGKKLSVVIPIYNEVNSVNKLLRRIYKALRKVTEFEVIFIDDNSTDGTFEKIQKFKSKNKHIKTKQIKIFRKEGKKGKAFSLLEGFSRSTGDLVAMIDADLQYPPEAIPHMLNSIKNADIVVANRKNYKDSIVRKILSNTFRFIFGKLIFGLDHDIQSGLKLMTRNVIERIKFTPSSSWTFDLEFLHRAKQAGFKILNLDISFARRENDISKVNFIKTTFEIGFNTLLLRTKIIEPVTFWGKNSQSMLGAGIGYKSKKYITHTNIAHHASAIKTFTFAQKIGLMVLVLTIFLGLKTNLLLTFQLIIAFISFVYFVDVIFNLFIVIRSLKKSIEIDCSLDELAKIDEKALPVYTILCPLYKESSVLPQFLIAMNRLSWPKDKLDVILLLEEDDKKTINAVSKLDLPFYVRILIVPHSIPKTKPKACNFGLSHARGDYIVIYDAEDMPESMQLKIAYLGFQKVKSQVICLQAKLSYYNPHQNILTRFFTAEYSLWFDVMLPGFQSLNTTIPLGGTSNHFKTYDLKSVGGWDPFNVTEDADLGMRLFKKGYKTAIINSTTLEEANSQIGNWLRQRSRWIKGYMQTYLVHMRSAISFAKQHKIHSLIFHLIIGGKIAFILINPMLWIATTAYFVLYEYVGNAIEALYPTWVFYMAVTSLVFGNFLFLYYYMIGIAKKGQWNLMKFALFIPIYWLLMSLASFIALFQLFFRPHFWEKTVHGFHLEKPNKKVIVDAFEGSNNLEGGLVIPAYAKSKFIELFASKKTYIGGIFLIITSVIANFLNFVFNAYLGRALDFSEFALIGLIGGLFSFASIIFGAFSTTANFRSGFLIGKYGENVAFRFWRYLRSKVIFYSIIATAVWILLTPLLMNYFGNNNPFLFIVFGVILLVGLAGSADRGFLSSRLKFGSIAILNIFDPVIKLIAAFLFVYLGLNYWTFVSIPLAILGTFFIGWTLAVKNKANKTPKITREIKKFPKSFFVVSILSGFSSIVFISADILLANHFLSQSEAGKYTLLSLVGKMVFFSGSLVSPFITPLVSRSEGAKKNSIKTLYLLLLSTIILSLGGFLLFGLLGSITIPFLYGDKAFAIVPYLAWFTLGMALYTTSRVFVNYYLVKRIYTFIIASSLLAIVQVVLIYNHHNGFGAIALIMTIIWGLHLFMVALLHFGIKYVKTFESNCKDFISLFSKDVSKKSNKLNILILNWRDTKHKWAGGAETYIHELAKRWVRDGNYVTVFCGVGNEGPKNEKIDGVEIFRRGGYYTVYIWAFFYYIFKFKGRYDIIIDCENGIPFFTPLYAKEKKFLLIHHVHQEIFRKSLMPPFSWLASYLEGKLMPMVYRNVEIITVSPSSREEIIRHKLTKKEPVVIYNGVDLTKFKPGEKSKLPLVLYLGRLQHYKSLNIFIRAARKVLEIIPNIEFVIAGEGEEKKALMKLVRKLDLGQNIKFLGKVSEIKKIKLLQSAWVFVNPSFMEGWGTTTIEANACATPAIASDVPGLRDSVKNPHTGILVKYGDIDKFAEKIVEIVKNNKLRKELSIQSVKWAKNFSWVKSSQEYISLFKKNYKISKKLDIAIMDMDSLRNPFWAAGQARATREVGRRLALKHKVTVYTSKYPGYKDYEEDGITYKHIGLVSNSPKITNMAYILSIFFVVKKIKSHIIIENFNAPTSVSFSPLFTKTPIIALPTMFNAKEFANKYHIPFHWFEKIGMKLYKYILPYSEVDAAKATKLNPNIKYKIIPQGVGREFFEIKHKKPQYILFLGRFDLAHKGIDLLLDAYSKVYEKIKYPLVLVGHGPDEDKIRNIIVDLKLEKKVKIVKASYGRDKIDLISKALFVAFPSRHDEISIWALEALASGLPIVAYDIPESYWMNNSSTLKAKPFDTKEYAQLLIKATDLKLNKKMSKACRLLAQKYTWEKVVNELENFIKEVIKKEQLN